MQPQEGVYGWYAQREGRAPIAIYIGMAGQKHSILHKGTLFRGVSELQRNTFMQEYPDRNYLDTDFIVGTTIILFERNGYSCVWKHLSDKPNEELDFVKKGKPILQNLNNARIRDEFRMKKDEKGYWRDRKTKEGIDEAEKAISDVLNSLIFNRS